MASLSFITDFLKRLLSVDQSAAGQVVDRRSTPRRMYMRQGALVFLNRPAYPAADCMIRDLSPAGAQIEVLTSEFDETLLLGSLRLYIAEKKHERDCRIVWRRSRIMGVKFSGPPHPVSRDFRHALQRGG